jgi:hypothetical protein
MPRALRQGLEGLESRGTERGLDSLERRPKAAARLGLEASTGWASPSSRGLWGGHALLLSPELRVRGLEARPRRQTQGSSKIGLYTGREQS